MIKSKSKWTRFAELVLNILELALARLAQVFSEQRSSKTGKK